MSNLVRTTINGTEFWCTIAQRDALEVLTSTKGGGMATVHGYVSESNRISPETADIQFISRFSYSRLLERKVKALESLTLDAIRKDCTDAKLTALTEDALLDTFETRKAYLIESCNKTLEGVRDDARRQAHDRNYHRVADGVRIHWKTVKTVTETLPVLLEGLPIAESIKLGIIQISKRVTVPGEYKVVNSKPPVLIGKVMEKSLPKSVKYKELTLKDGKFESLSISGETLEDADFKSLF